MTTHLEEQMSLVNTSPMPVDGSTDLAVNSPSILTTIQTLTKTTLGLLNELLGYANSRNVVDSGLIFTGYGIALAIGRKLFDMSYNFFNYTMISRMEVESKDDSYEWLLTYLTDPKNGKSFNHFAVTTSIKSKSSNSYYEEKNEGYNTGLKFHQLPSTGSHSFFHKGRIMWLSRNSTSGLDRSSSEMIQIDCLGPKAALEGLITDAQVVYSQKDRHRTIVYACDQYGAWRRIRSRLARKLDTVITNNNIKETVLNDVHDFMASEAWYTSRGIPYRRGYMFYGPPGSGKTSLVTALAGELGVNIYTLSLANKNLTDDTFIEALVDTPIQCVLLLEDIDAAFKNRKSKQGITFAGLLNALDGVAAQEGRILCMTTNHYDKLDPALVRPGRVDVLIEFTHATHDMISDLFLRFYDCPKDIGVKLSDKIPDNVFSMAEIQGFLMLHKGDPLSAIEAADSWVSITMERKNKSSTIPKTNQSDSDENISNDET